MEHVEEAEIHSGDSTCCKPPVSISAEIVNELRETTDRDKEPVVTVAKQLRRLGFGIFATSGTARYLRAAGIECETVNKVLEGRPHIVDRMVNGEVALVVNTTEGEQSALDSLSMRRTALAADIPYFTTLAGALAAVHAIEAARAGGRVLPAVSLQEYHRQPQFEAGEEPSERERYRPSGGAA